MSHDGQTILAHTLHGHIKQCFSGCIHLTFGQVTLHFPSEEEFEAMGRVVAAESEARESDETFDVHYHWFSMSLTDHGSRELTRLVRSAMAEMAWRRGDFEFTDDDLNQIRARCAS